MKVLEKNCYKLKPMKITAMKVLNKHVILNEHAPRKRSM